MLEYDFCSWLRSIALYTIRCTRQVDSSLALAKAPVFLKAPTLRPSHDNHLPFSPDTPTLSRKGSPLFGFLLGAPS